MIRSLFAMALVALFSVSAFAQEHCDLAEQLTQSKVSAECRTVFLNVITNDQDKVDMRHFFETWKAPADFVISRYGSILQVQEGDQPTLEMMFVSQEPLVVVINNKVYTDVSTDKSWSRRFQKIFAQAKADTKTASHHWKYSPFIMGNEAYAALPPDPVDAVGHAFSVVTNGGTVVSGSASDVLSKLQGDDGYAPNYSGTVPETLASNAWEEGRAQLNELLHPIDTITHVFSGGTDEQKKIRARESSLMHTDVSCDAKGSVKDAKYKFLGDRGVVARMIGKDTVAVRGLLPNNQEVKIQLNSGRPSPKGQECVEKFTSGNDGQCQKSFSGYMKSHPKMAAKYKTLLKRKKSVTCASLATSKDVQDCRNYTRANTRTKSHDDDDSGPTDIAAAGNKHGGGDNVPDSAKIVAFDGKKSHSTLSICNNDDCSDSKVIHAKDLASYIDPTNSLEPKKDPSVSSDQNSSEMASTDPDSTNADPAKKNHRRRKKDHPAAADDSSGPTSTAAKDPKARDESPAAVEGRDVHRILEKIAVGMDLYSTCCASSQCRDAQSNIVGAGTKFNKESGVTQ